MKTKYPNIPCLLIVFFCSVLAFDCFAQNSTTLNVNLYPIQTLVVNPAQQDVTLNYISKEDYAQGVTSLQADHLSIYSTGGFQIKVESSEEHSNKYLPKNSISVVPSSGSKPMLAGNVGYLEKNLSEQGQPIITSTTGGFDKNFNISYKGAGADMYIDYYDASGDVVPYRYNVIYTIVSQ